MTEIQFRSDVTVELVRSSAQDADVLFAARVSTQGEQTLERRNANRRGRRKARQGSYQLPHAGSTRFTV